MKHITLLLTLALSAALPTAISAHHSMAAAYRLHDTHVLEGTVVMVAFKEPHSYVHLATVDRDGVHRRWSLEWASATALLHTGVTRATLRPGDHVQVIGHPGRNVEAGQMLIVHVTRPADGWTWGNQDLE
jgi:hypothetical protein